MAVILSSPKAKILIKCIAQIFWISVSIFLSNFKLPKIIPKACIFTVCFFIKFFITIAKLPFSFKKNLLFVRNNQNLKTSFKYPKQKTGQEQQWTYFKESLNQGVLNSLWLLHYIPIIVLAYNAFTVSYIVIEIHIFQSTILWILILSLGLCLSIMLHS